MITSDVFMKGIHLFDQDVGMNNKKMSFLAYNCAAQSTPGTVENEQVHIFEIVLLSPNKMSAWLGDLTTERGSQVVQTFRNSKAWPTF